MKNVVGIELMATQLRAASANSQTPTRAPKVYLISDTPETTWLPSDISNLFARIRRYFLSLHRRSQKW